MVVVYLLAVVLVVGVILFFLTSNNHYWKSKGVAAPEPRFFFGNLKDLVLQRAPKPEVFEEIYLRYPNERLVGLHWLRTPILLVRDLDLVRHVMVKDFGKFLDRDSSAFGKNDLGETLATASCENWINLRKCLSPIFSADKLKNMFYLIDSHGDNFLDYLDRTLKERPERDVYPLFKKYTLSTISACAFGQDFKLSEFDDTKYAMMDKEIFSRNYMAELDFFLPRLMNLLNICYQKTIIKFFGDLNETILKKREIEPINRRDFIDSLLEIRKSLKKDHSNKDLSDTFLAAQSYMFYAEGYETSSTTMSFLLHELALNPEVQDRLVEEINEVLERDQSNISFDCLDKMCYMDQVFDEVLRMYPPVDPLQRHTTAPYFIPGTVVAVPTRTLFVVSVRGIHYDEKYYPEPHKFDPDRFSPDNVKNRHPCAYMPFGLGPRNCIGMQFAKMQLKSLLAKLLLRYRVEPAGATRKNFVYDSKRNILRSKYGVPLKFVPRT